MELLIATVLVALAGMAARIAGNDMQERRRIDQLFLRRGSSWRTNSMHFADQAAL
jgi:hypothetical protein